MVCTTANSVIFVSTLYLQRITETLAIYRSLNPIYQNRLKSTRNQDTLKAVNLSQIEILPEPETIHGDNRKRMDGKVDKSQVIENNNYAKDVKRLSVSPMFLSLLMGKNWTETV